MRVLFAPASNRATRILGALASAGIHVRTVADEPGVPLSKLRLAGRSLLAVLSESADMVLTDMCTAGPLLTVWPAFFQQRPVVIRLRADPWQTDENEVRRSHFPLVRSQGSRTLTRIFYQHADALVPVSDYLARRISEKTSVDDARVTTIREPVDLERFSSVADPTALKRKLDLAYAHVVCVVFNFYYEDKVQGLEHFLPVLHALVEKHSDVAVAIAGAGPLHAAFARDNERWLQHPRLVLTGHIDRVEQIYQCSDVCAHFSFFDAAPRVLLEASACGLPVIVNDHPALTENLRGNQIGYVVGNDPDEAVSVFEKVLYCPEHRREMGANGRAFAERNCRVERIGEHYRELFEKLVAKG